MESYWCVIWGRTAPSQRAPPPYSPSLELRGNKSSVAADSATAPTALFTSLALSCPVPLRIQTVSLVDARSHRLDTMAN